MIAITLTVLAAASMATSSVVQTPNPDGFELLILHNNDMHARFEQTSQLSGTCTVADRDAGKCYGGFPRVAYVVKEARKAAASGVGPPVLYLNAGDTYTGTAWFTIYKWKIAAEFINALQPDAVSLGNHEFDNGVEGLTPFIRNITCPVLASNLILTKEPELAMETNLNKYIIIDIANHKVGIIGYLTPKTKVEARENNVEYIDEIIAIREQVKELKSQGVNILIALGHSGYIKDVEIAKEVEGLDLVIGGHTNTFLWNGTAPDSEVPVGPYPTYVTQASGRKVPVVQAYAYTKYLGRLHIVFNSKEEVIHIDGNPILLDKTIPQDPQVLAIIDRYRHNVNNIADRYVGNTSVVLSSQCKVECNLGNLITDAMVYRYAFDHVGEYWTDASIAILQKGGIRSSIAHSTMPADVTEGDLLTVMPFVGNLVVVTMNGNTLRQMLEHSVADHKYLPGKFLQYSGIRVEYDLKRANMSRVVSAKALCANCKIPMYEKIQDDNTYKVIMPNFVYNGGDGFSMFKGLPVVTLEYSELEATQFYIRHHSPIFTAVEGRIVLNDIEDDKDSAFHLYPSKVLMLSTILLAIAYRFD